MSIICKYLIISVYLLIVMITSYTVSKITKNNEISRNIVHIFAGFGWIFYKLFFPATIHPIIISFCFLVITIITKKLNIQFIERNSASLGTIYFTLSMLIMSILGYKSIFLFDIFGFAIICLSCGDAAANIIGSRYGKNIIYENKSVEGMLACFCSSATAIFLLKEIYEIKFTLLSICFVALLCAITELFSADYDNIAIPTIVYISTYIVLTNNNISHIIISLLVAISMFIFAYKFKLLEINASYILFIMIFTLYYFGGFKSYISLMLVFLVIIIIEKILHKKTDIIFANINKEHGVRNCRQLLANCLLAVILINIYGFTQNNIYIILFFVAISETISDSVASNVGVLSKKNPVDICTFKTIQQGISGGVSLIGTISSFIVCIYASILYLYIYEFNIYIALVILTSSFFGVILDSVLGSKLQIQYRCVVCNKITEQEYHCEKNTLFYKGYKFFDNTTINFLCNLSSVVMAYLILVWR